MKFPCRFQCHKLEGYQKGCYRFAEEGKRWCSNCDYKIPTNERSCPCCKGCYRVIPRKSKSRQMLILRRQAERTNLYILEQTIKQ